jgi:hypothetical protein
MAKGYTIFRLIYHYSRWTTIQAEEICKEKSVIETNLFPFKCELKFRPFKTLFIILCLTLVYITPILRLLEVSFEPDIPNDFNLDTVNNSAWVVVITMTTVGYGDLYPKTHFGRGAVVLACLIGMLLVSYLVVGMNSMFDFNPQENRAFGKLKKLSATDSAKEKAANVIKNTFIISKHKNKKIYKRFIYGLLLKKHISIFKNENMIAHSRLLPTDQMIRNLEEKLRSDLYDIRNNIFELANFEDKCESIRVD